VWGDESRIGTEERSLALEALGTHLAGGRLTSTEYEERAGAATAARTRADLAPLFADLPPPHPPYLVGADLPEPLRGLAATEGLVLLVQDVPGELSYRRYRDGQVRYRRRSVPALATVAVTGKRLLAWTDGVKQVDIPLGHPLMRAVELTAQPPGVLRLVTDVSKFHPDRTGRITLTVQTTRAIDVVRLWQSRLVNPGPA